MLKNDKFINNYLVTQHNIKLKQNKDNYVLYRDYEFTPVEKAIIKSVFERRKYRYEILKNTIIIDNENVI